MANNNLLDILELVPSRLNGILQLMLLLISDSCKDVRELRTPDLGVVLSAARLPQDDALDGVFDQTAIDGQRTPLVDKGLVLCRVERHVPSPYDEALVGLEPAALEQPHLCARRAHVGDVVRHGAGLEL